MELWLKQCPSRDTPLQALRTKRDRISSLPDELLTRIVSLLTTKEAAATTVLSKRWSHILTNLTSLEFDESPICHCLHTPRKIARFSTFKTFVDSVLHSQASRSENLSMFKLRLGAAKINIKNIYPSHKCGRDCYPDMNSMHLNAWICFPLTLGVKEIVLDIRVKKPGKLPWELFTCKTIEVLKLNVNLAIEPPMMLSSFGGLPNLKVFHLSSVSNPVHDFVTALVAGSPLLEDLSLRSCERKLGNVVNITSPSLRRLLLDFLDYRDFDFTTMFQQVVLDTPNLEYFEYKDNYVAPRYSVKNMHSLVDSVIFMYKIDRKDQAAFQFQNMLNLLIPMSGAHKLCLKGRCVEVLQRGDLKDKLPVFHNLKELHLGESGPSNSWHNIWLGLLNCSPFLETLGFQGGFTLGGKVDVRSAELEFHTWTTTEAVPCCFKSHLKKVVIRYYAGSKRELNFVTFLLRNALVLEELLIWTDPVANRAFTESTIKMLPRASTKCSIVCHYQENPFASLPTRNLTLEELKSPPKVHIISSHCGFPNRY